MKILIAEDEPVSRRVLEATLQGLGYTVIIAPDGQKAWEIIRSSKAPNLVISDWMMPHMDGLQLCRKIRQTDQSGYIYFIILTAKGNKEDIITGLEAGADDFLVKPFDHEELKYRIRIGERIIRLEHRILELANTDPLTGILNRRAFMERMEQEINRSGRDNSPLSFILSDIDYFKKVNDTYGHQAGDIVLQKFSNRLKTSIRPYDFIGRYGGEEFVVCLPGADENQSQFAAERIRKQVEEMEVLFADSSKSIRITASFGVASLQVDSDDHLDDLIRRADDAVYRAKNEGRNRVCFCQ